LATGDFKSQFGLRIGLGVATEADARLIVPDDSRIAVDDLARLDHPGSGIVSQGKSGRVVPVTFFRLDHDDIGPIAERVGWIQGPDPRARSPRSARTSRTAGTPTAPGTWPVRRRPPGRR
jgi:hypothetical protein